MSICFSSFLKFFRISTYMDIVLPEKKVFPLDFSMKIILDASRYFRFIKFPSFCKRSKGFSLRFKREMPLL